MLARTLTADSGLSASGLFRWMLANGAAVVRGEAALPRHLDAVRHAPAAIAPGPLAFEEPSGRASTLSSPGRLLSIDASIRVCRLVAANVHDPIHVLDLGCGTGGFLSFFRGLLPGFTSYMGVDIEARPSWSEHAAADASFLEADAAAFLESCDLEERPPFNFVYSNSALEHMREDDRVIRALARLGRRRDVVQFHVVPASAALPLYRWHGYRVYTSADVARLAREFAPSQVRVFPLGSARSWSLHLLGLRDRDRRPERYAERLLAAAARDIEQTPRFPIMWAILVTPSGWQQ